MSDDTPAGASKTRRFLIESAARTSHRNRILERLLNLFSFRSKARRLREELLDTAVEAIPCEAATLFVKRPRNALVVEATRGPVAGKLRDLKLKAGEGVAGACLADARTIAISDAGRDPRHAAEIARKLDAPVRSLLAVPIPRGGEVIGVLELINKRGSDEFQRHEIELMERVARTAGDLIKAGG